MNPYRSSDLVPDKCGVEPVVKECVFELLTLVLALAWLWILLTGADT